MHANLATLQATESECSGCLACTNFVRVDAALRQVDRLLLTNVRFVPAPLFGRNRARSAHRSIMKGAHMTTSPFFETLK